MLLFCLLLVPIIIGGFGFYFGKGRINLREFGCHIVVACSIIGLGYGLALQNRSHDIEHWNGVITIKDMETTGCCHSYPCNCHEICSGSGEDRSCYTHCDTCHLHSHDKEFFATTSNGENAYSDGCNAPGDEPPARWKSINIGEPTSIEHGFTNYIKGNPDSILRRQGSLEKWANHVPAYPRVYDYYRASKILIDGLNVPELQKFNEQLSKINARLGKEKQVNIIIILTSVRDLSYAEAVKEAWLGGKKNDFIVIVGLSDYPTIEWVNILSWTTRESLKVTLRNALLEQKTFDESSLMLIEEAVKKDFVIRQWQDFDYLKATVEPTPIVQAVLMFVGVLLSIGLQIYFYHEDPFNQ